MINHVLQISTVFASIMAASSFALAITIAAAGITEKTGAGCYGCLHTTLALKATPGKAAALPTRSMQVAFGAAKVVGTIE